ncbi:trichodiene oxygenase [Seiridium cupressi]
MDSQIEFIAPGSILSWTNLGRLAGLWIIYGIIRALYNVSPLHPLSHIPGPKVAAATFLYEGWYDLIQGGRYTREIKRMHELYGPVVRINPEELHFDDINSHTFKPEQWIDASGSVISQTLHQEQKLSMRQYKDRGTKE